MQADNKELQRLGRGGEAPLTLEARAGAFLADARETVGLRDAEVTAIERRLLRGESKRRRSWLWPAVAGLAVLLVAGSVSALVGGWRPRLPFIRSLPEGAPEKREPKAARPARAQRTDRLNREANGSVEPPPASPAATAADLPAAPSVAPTVESRPAVVRRAPRQEAALAPASPSPSEIAPSEGALSIEARSLADALARWRRDGNARAALALLGAHDQRFPHGALAVESKVARAEILLALRRGDQALAVLDSLVLQGLPRARELAAIRGELRAQTGRCREARVDLLNVLRDTASDELGKRATLALGQCP